MNKLLEPELKSVPPRGDIFVLYCSHCLKHYLLPVYREGGDRVFLPVWRQIAMIWGQELKKAFWMVAILYACFRFKYDVFRKKIIPFEAVNRKNNF